jgi:hypothetical protein
VPASRHVTEDMICANEAAVGLAAGMLLDVAAMGISSLKPYKYRI